VKKPLAGILGCGPSGLLAAHACAMRGVEFVIFSKAMKSRLGGAQFSHIPIPGIHEYDDPDVKLTYKVTGDAATYQEKVYGGTNVPFVSFDNVTDGQVVPAWNLRYMNDRLWEMYSAKIVNVEVDYTFALGLTKAFDIVFSAIPTWALCQGIDAGVMHAFREQTVRIYNEAIDPSLPDNMIWYNGDRENSWYRMSRLFGVGSTEWGSHSAKPPLPNIVTVNKPIWTNCDCLQKDLGGGVPAVVRIGRFGTYEKGKLTMHAYQTVIDTMLQFGIE
jgi:hypothetical protein